MLDDRDRQGRFTGKHTDGDVLAAVRAHAPAGTNEVADELGVTRQAVDYRLRRLRDEGRVVSKKIGGSLVWFIPDGSDESAESRPHGRAHASESDAPGRQGSPPERAHAGDTATRADVSKHVPVDDFPAGVDADAGLAAIAAARDYLRDHGPASKREIVTAVMPDHPLGYEVPDLEPGERYRGAWWRKVVKPGLDALPDAEYRQGHGDYRYAGESADG